VRKRMHWFTIFLGLFAGWVSAGTVPSVPGNDGSFLDWDASVNGTTGWSSSSGASLTLESPDGVTPGVRVVDNSTTASGYGYINYNSTIPADTVYVMTLKFWANAVTWNGMIALERNTSWQKAGACLWEGGTYGDLRWDTAWQTSLRDEDDDVYTITTGQWYTITIKRNSLTEFEVWVDDGTTLSYLGTQTSSLSNYNPRSLFVGGTDSVSHTFDGSYAFVKVGNVGKLAENDYSTWREFVPNITKTEAGAVSLEFLLDPPAGKHGVLQVEDGHLVFEDGTPGRFWGTNILAWADTPSYDQAEAIADTLARYGVNAVRFHLPEMGITAYDSVNQMFKWNGTHWDRFDYFFYCLKQKGIYVMLDSLAGLNWRSQQSYANLGYTIYPPPPGAFYFDPDLRQIARNFLTSYLTRTNYYTGMTLATDPAVIMGMLLNETGIMWDFGSVASLSTYYIDMLRAQYNAWLLDKYGTRANLAEAWRISDTETALESWEDPALGNIDLPTYSFLQDTSGRTPLQAAASTTADPAERIRAREAVRFLQHLVEDFRDDLTSTARQCGAEFPILVTNVYKDIAELKTAIPTGVISQNSYWDHVSRGTNGELCFGNTPAFLSNPVDRWFTVPMNILSQNVVDCALISTETSLMWPQDWRAYHMMMQGAIASHQQVDAMFHYCFAGGYGYDWDVMAAREGVLQPTVDYNDPAILSSIIAGSFLYLRGDVDSANAMVSIDLDENQQYSAGLNYRMDSGVIPAKYLPYVTGFKIRYPDQSPIEADYTIMSADLLTITETSSNRLAYASQLDQQLKAQNVIPADTGWNQQGEYVTSDTRQLIYDYGNDLYLIKTPKSQGFAGFPRREVPIDLGDVRVVCDSSFSVIQLSSLDDQPLAESNRMLLVAVARAHNRDIDISYTSSVLMPNGGYRGTGMVAQAGSVGPVVIEAVRAQLTLGGERIRLSPLNPNMVPDVASAREFTGSEGEVTVEVSGEGDYSIWYLVERLGSSVIPGDANGDGMVDVGDLGILAANYGKTNGVTWSQGDFNEDGAVDVGDLGILAAHYGEGTSGADWDADYARVFGETAAGDDLEIESVSDMICSGLGFPLIAGLAIMGLMLVKLEK
jgi:hypothetical protein